MGSRSGSLEGQVVGVVKNHNEFNMSMDSIVNRVLENKSYKEKIAQLYNNKRVDFNIRHAIASYIRTLNTFDSKFDKNIRGEEKTLLNPKSKDLIFLWAKPFVLLAILPLFLMVFMIHWKK